MSSYKIYTRLMGGINYQIEHHLFPTLCNHKLAEISPIVKKTCKEFNIPHNNIEHPKDILNNLTKTYLEVLENN